MDEEEIYPALQDVFADVFGREDIVLNANTSAKDVAGWDSFRQIEIVVAVQERFGVKFRTRDLDELRNVGDLVRLIHNNVKAKRSSHD
jgi:acyl carrier protein